MPKFHKDFRLNGDAFSSDKELLDFAREISTPVYDFLFNWFSADDFVVVQTSGSTGNPKEIQLKKEYMKNSAKATGEFFNLPENTTALLCLSTDYIAGKMMLIRALTLGWSIDVIESTSEVKVEKEYDFSAMVPMQLRNSLSQIHKIKKLIVGGGVVSNDLKEQVQNSTTEIFATYGMTETITHIAVKKLNKFDKTVEVYNTLPNVKIYTDQRNCLCIKANNISNEFIVTNDVVQLISDTQFEWLGRYDNVINSGGVKLHPEKIEEKLSEIISNRFFVIGINDEILGQKLILLIEGKEGKEGKINLDIVKGLSQYEKPKEIYFVDEFVETETKKIQRKKTLLKIFPN